jgi:hypothetical protein
MENLFRRFKGEVVDVKTVSGGIYAGRVVEVTNDYVCLTETSGAPGQQVFSYVPFCGLALCSTSRILLTLG